MKGYSESRGQLFRMSYDAATGIFINVPIACEFSKSAREQEDANPPVHLQPRTLEQPKSASAITRHLLKRSA
jgi:hypothetical protein